MSRLPNEFITKIAHSLQEEIDVYLLSLYSLDSEDMYYFPKKDRDRIKKILQRALVDPVQKNARLTRFHA